MDLNLVYLSLNITNEGRGRLSITKSYNKKLGIYYAYETEYLWDESLKRKVQKKKIIGHFDPATGKIVPNKKRGRPPLKNEYFIGQSISESPEIGTNQLIVSNLSSTLTALEDVKKSLEDLNQKIESIEEQTKNSIYCIKNKKHDISTNC